MDRAIAAVLLLPILSGCVGDSFPDAADASAETLWQEHVRLRDEPVSWQREVPLGFQLVPSALDAWARPTAMLRFDYLAMRLYQQEGSRGDMQWVKETLPLTYDFRQADGALAAVNLPERSSRFFMPESSGPLTGGFEAGVFLFMTWWATGEIQAPFTDFGINFTFVRDAEPFDRDDCRGYSLTWEEQENSTVAVCVHPDEMLPRAVIVDNDHWSGEFTRIGGDLALPAPAGEVEPPVVFDRRPMERVFDQGLDVYGPPIAHDGDWAEGVHARIAGLLTDRNFPAFAATHPDLYPRFILAGFPDLSTVLLGTAPLASHDWEMLTDGRSLYWGATVNPQAVDVHVAERPGIAYDADPLLPTGFEFEPYGYPALEQLPDFVPAGDLAAAYDGVVPTDPGHFQWLMWPWANETEYEVWATSWVLADSCWEEDKGDRYAFVSAATGQLLGIGNVTRYISPGSGSCSMGLWLPAATGLAPVHATLRLWSDGRTDITYDAGAGLSGFQPAWSHVLVP